MPKQEIPCILDSGILPAKPKVALVVRSKIQILPDDIALTIAAGEVIERPASVVKELLENSLDAGAQDISIDITDGGLGQIAIYDNGEGVPYSEIEMPFIRFATSKMHRDLYLSGVSTLGFRGEALPSIAAVAHVEMVSKVAQDDVAGRVEISQGKIIRKERTGAPLGTSVVVRSLFSNVPARLKFLKSVGVETNHITQVVVPYVLGRPDVRFSLNIDGKLKLNSPGTGRALDAVRSVYGVDKAAQFLSFEFELPDQIWLSGLVSDPSVTAGNRNGIVTLVNGRSVKNRNLQFAVESAFHGVLKERRYPIAMINIGLPLSNVDVNVHPAKAEIKFSHQDVVFDSVKAAIRQALTNVPIATPVVSRVPRTIAVGQASRSEEVATANLFADSNDQSHNPDSKPSPEDRLPVLRVVGQIASCYLVAEGYQGMYLIDQHAAHERVWFEKLRAMINAKDLEIQGLLEPIVIEVPELFEEAMGIHQSLLKKYGFDCEPFGSNTYVLRGVPLILGNLDPRELFLNAVYGIGSGQSGEPDQDALIKTLACHGSVRAGQKLSVAEMQELLRDLESSPNFRTCPHGRPTVLSFDVAFIEKQFGRR